MKEIIRKSVAIVFLTIVLLLLMQTVVSLCVERELGLVSVPIASRDLLPRVRIEEEDIFEVEVPKAYVQPETIVAKEALVGRYTDIQGKIPAGSLFYSSMIKEIQDLPDQPILQLKEDQSAYSLQADLSMLAGTIIAGQRVDVYVTLEPKDAPLINGCLFKSVRVLAVKDGRGLELSDPDSTGIPYMAVLALSSRDLSWLACAEEVGNVRLFANSESYESNREAILQEGDVLSYLESLM